MISTNCSWYHELKDLDRGDVAGQDVARIDPADGGDIEDGDTIIPTEYERLTGSTDYYGTVRVKIEKVV